MQAMNTQAVSP